MTTFHPPRDDRARLAWRAAWASLTALFVLTATLDMLHVRGGFLTDHLADLVVPAWLYVATRGLAGHRRGTLLTRTVGANPWLAAATVFAASTATELSQKFWPHGIFAGTFDPLDIVAYATGTGLCLIADLRTQRVRSGGSLSPSPPSREATS